MKYVEQLIYKLIVWEDLLICEGKNEKKIYIYIPLESWKEYYEIVAWEVSLVQDVCVSRLCEWKEGRKRMRKHSNPEKQFKNSISAILISNTTAMLFYSS